MEAAAALIAAKADAVARELVIANAGLQAGQTRQENAAREADDAKKKQLLTFKPQPRNLVKKPQNCEGR